MENSNNMKIFNGSYMDINPNKEGYINISASVTCNHKEKLFNYATYIRNDGGIMFYGRGINDENLVTYDKLKKMGDSLKYIHLRKLHKLQNYNDSNSIHKDHDIIRKKYRDSYRREELLVKNCHNFCKDLELKYLLIKDHLLQNHGDIFLMRVIFDIKHYLSILLCYYGLIDHYELRIRYYANHANAILLNNNLPTCNDDDVNDGDLFDIDESDWNGIVGHEEEGEMV
jgi:hypothetical protein